MSLSEINANMIHMISLSSRQQLLAQQSWGLTDTALLEYLQS
jgi:hypothetical protein